LRRGHWRVSLESETRAAKSKFERLRVDRYPIALEVYSKYLRVKKLPQLKSQLHSLLQLQVAVFSRVVTCNERAV
jgi:hypothetical protein